VVEVVVPREPALFTSHTHVSTSESFDVTNVTHSETLWLSFITKWNANPDVQLLSKVMARL